MIKHLLSIAVWAAATMTVQAQPANNTCGGAINVPVNTDATCAQATTVTMPTNATASPGAVSCLQTGNLRDLWYSFTATSRTHFIRLTGFSGTLLSGASPRTVLALYSGACDSLNELFCIANNGMLAHGLEIGETYLIRIVTDATAAGSYSFNLCVNTPQASGGGSTACPIFTINAGFEEPMLPTFSFVHHNRVLGWRTTATDLQIEFWTSGFRGVPAYEGNQFVELNANQASSLFQDYETPFPVTFNYSFAHRGRNGTDVARVMMGPPGGPFTQVVQVSTGNTAWQVYTGSFDIPAGQSVTRIFFEAVGGGSVGNFLDAVNFSAEFGVTSEPFIERCLDNQTAINIAAREGVGAKWSADPDNPTPLNFGNPSLVNTTVNGFKQPGLYTIYWANAFCTDVIEILVKECGVTTNPSLPSGKKRPLIPENDD